MNRLMKTQSMLMIDKKLCQVYIDRFAGNLYKKHNNIWNFITKNKIILLHVKVLAMEQ